jgi:ribonuclease HI
MGCFELTKILCDEISAMVCRFWWNQQEGKQKIHWLSRETMMKPKEEGGLGFRDIHAFNLAMLAKQSWRLWHNPDSLCARVLKAKYYATTSVLEAKPKHGMSYTWRSILHGLDIMKKGMIWRLGDGSNLKIWTDPWLPRDQSRRPITPRGANLLTYVEELINPITGSWDEKLVKETFWEEDATIILAIPIFEGRENNLAWHYDKKGLFSVRSAYRVCRDDLLRRAIRGGPQGSSRNQPDPIWGKIWDLNCPSKIKHFIWRFSYNSHPLRCNLVRRDLKIDTVCPICGREEEDGAHLFFKCKLARNVWQLLSFEGDRVVLAALNTPVEALEHILKAKEQNKLLMVILLWFLWTERNIVREEGKRRSADTLARSIRLYAAEISKAQGEEKLRLQRPTERWSRPPVGMLKMNCDASFKAEAESNTGSWGFIIRDNDGDVVLIGRGRINHLLSAFHAEVIAGLQGVQAALNVGIRRLILQTDSLMLQQELTSVMPCARPEGGLMNEMKSLVASNFTAFECVFKRRECNRPAHVLAELGFECVEGHELITSSIPNIVNVLVAADRLADE